MSGQAVRLGFTLAEVLVTLGIIGVVSAMTVPSLMQNHQRKTYVVQLHKVYNEFSQALLQYQTDKNAVNLTEAGLSSQGNFDAFVSDYFKTVQKCDNSLTPCFALDEFRTLSGKSYSSGHAAATSYVLNNGVAIRPHYSNGDIYILADINAQKGPNIFGRDLFYMILYPDIRLDEQGADAGPLDKDLREEKFTTNFNNDGAWGYFGKILNDNWEMNY